LLLVRYAAHAVGRDSDFWNERRVRDETLRRQPTSHERGAGRPWDAPATLARLRGIWAGLNLLVFAFGATLALAACASSSAPSARTPRLLPRSAIVSLRVVERSLPEITVEARSGEDETATGNPVATRSVTFTNAAHSKKVTISADRYDASRDASSAYREAVAKSEAVAGFKPLTVPNLGAETFSGSVTQRGETHVGLGVLVGAWTAGATIAGFDADSTNLDKLVSVARAEVATAQAKGVFAAPSTGAVPVSDIYGSNVDPGFSKWLTLQLSARADLAVFERLERTGTRLPHATLTDEDDGYRYGMEGVEVLSHRVEAGSGNAVVRIGFDRLHLWCGPPACKTPSETPFASRAREEKSVPIAP
jgi:hypothetical protein